MGAWGFILSFSLLLWVWSFPQWKFRREKRANKDKVPGRLHSLPCWIYVEIKRDNIQVLHKSWFLSFPFRNCPRATCCIRSLSPQLGTASKQFMLGFLEHRKVLTLVQRGHWPSWTLHQNWQMFIRIGRTDGRMLGLCPSTGPSSFPHTLPEVLGTRRLGPRSPRARGAFRQYNPQSWEGKGSVFKSIFPVPSSGQHPFKNSFISIRAITKMLSANSTWHVTGLKNVSFFSLHFVSIAGHSLTPIQE